MPSVFHNKGCATCGRLSQFVATDLPIGPRRFCTEKCYARYAGLPVRPEGYYGFVPVGFRGA